MTIRAALLTILVVLAGCGADDRQTVIAGPPTTPARADGFASPLDPAEAAFTDGWRPPPPTTAPPRRTLAARPPRASRSATRRAQTPGTAGDVLACIRGGGRYGPGESGGNYRAVSPSGKYRGAYQADQRTWDGTWRRHGRPDLVGADPADASSADQDQFASHLYAERGTQPWPNRGRCG